MSEPTDAEVGQAFRFIEPFISASMANTASLVQTIQDNLARSDAEQTAIIHAIREAVEDLFDGPYMPTPGAVIAALYPSRETWGPMADEILQQRGIHSSTHTERQ